MFWGLNKRQCVRNAAPVISVLVVIQLVSNATRESFNPLLVCPFALIVGQDSLEAMEYAATHVHLARIVPVIPWIQRNVKNVQWVLHKWLQVNRVVCPAFQENTKR